MTPTMPDEIMEWVEVEYIGWKLKDNAPAEIKKKFDDFMRLIKTAREIEE